MAQANILTDSCFWIALYTPEDTKLHIKAVELSKYLENNRVLVPWPTLYEFVNTRLARRKENLYAFQAFLLKPNVLRVSDDIYKERALDAVFAQNLYRMVSISLIDEVLRQMILDKYLGVDYLLTFNRKDFEYPCQLNNVMLLE